MDTLLGAPVLERDEAVAMEERFELLESLGKGGMGCVYKARDRLTGDIVALKTLLDRHAGDPTLAARLEREARFASRIRHANVAMVDGIVEAAVEMAARPERVRAWGERRSGALTVGHLDVLALPPR